MKTHCTKNLVALIFAACTLLSSCNRTAQQAEQTTTSTQKKPMQNADTHTFAQPDVAKVTHLDLTLKVDFDTKILTGKATYTLQKTAAATEIIFDTDGGLSITKVTLDSTETATSFAIGDSVPYLGKPLKITIAPTTQKVNIYYHTQPTAAAVQWLTPAQTAGKVQPFLFTQSQAILARTWLPCQDSPGIRFTYHATVQVPPTMLALMSAINPTQKNPQGTYTFTQPKAIPAYLMALAVGDIAFAKIGNRTGVYAEPTMIKAAAYEFAEMEKMLQAAEKLYGKYAWNRYDLIVLPPSFPFGGMENPELTFATPTILAGDRSLTSLVAHELAHSWSGNLVTNATWNDFWLNEGFTVYFERRIMEAIAGKPYAEMLEQLGYQDLQQTITEMGPTAADTKLKLELINRNPDDGMTDIAYEKGYCFLKLLENTYGRQKFDNFLKNYFNANAFKTIDTEGFLAYLDANLLQTDTALAQTIGIQEWIYQPGLPANAPATKAQRFVAVETELKKFEENKITAAQINNTGWSSHEYLHLLRKLPVPTTPTIMQALDAKFKFTQSGNNEILALWLDLAIKNDYAPAKAALEKFLNTVGRRKFIKPLYQSLKTKDPKRAATLYAKNRQNYHSVSTQTIDEMLKGL